MAAPQPPQPEKWKNRAGQYAFNLFRKENRELIGLLTLGLNPDLEDDEEVLEKAPEKTMSQKWKDKSQTDRDDYYLRAGCVRDPRFGCKGASKGSYVWKKVCRYL